MGSCSLGVSGSKRLPPTGSGAEMMTWRMRKRTRRRLMKVEEIHLKYHVHFKQTLSTMIYSFLWSMSLICFVFILFRRRRSDCRSRLLTSWSGPLSMKLKILFQESTFTKTPYSDRWRSVSHCPHDNSRTMYCTKVQSTCSVSLDLFRNCCPFIDIRGVVF